MKVRRYYDFIFENVSQEVLDRLTEKNKVLKTKILEKISKTIDIEDAELLSNFLDSIIRNPQDPKIESLINDSDIFEFYEIYSNEIDEILSEIDFYEIKPSDTDSFSLYKYVISGTLKAVGKLVEEIKSEILADKSIQNLK